MNLLNKLSLLGLTAVFIGNTACSQLSHNQLAENALIQFKKEYLAKEKYQFAREENSCIYDSDDIRMSCLEIDWKKEWMQDFNNDGNLDMVFEFIDLGLGGGSERSFIREIIVALLNADGSILKYYSVYGGDYTSESKLTIDQVKDQKIHATYTDEYNPKNSRKMTFYCKDGRLMESKTESCSVAKKVTEVFKSSGNLNKNTYYKYDFNFFENLQEQINLEDKSYYFVSVSGCSTANILISHHDLNLESINKNKASILQNELKFLEENTVFKTEMKQLQELVVKAKESDYTKDDYGTIFLNVSTKQYTADLIVSKETITVRLNQF